MLADMARLNQLYTILASFNRRTQTKADNLSVLLELKDKQDLKINKMKPKFKNTLAWEQAQVLMQPALIRLIDNIGKQLDKSSWEGTYQEVSTPYPGYLLCLTYNDRSVTVDVWNLCFQICFQDYNPTLSRIAEGEEIPSQEVEIDPSLLDETGEVDWHSLETKTQGVVKQVFANLTTG